MSAASLKVVGSTSRESELWARDDTAAQRWKSRPRYEGVR
jgi:hypothetical protein